MSILPSNHQGSASSSSSSFVPQNPNFNHGFNFQTHQHQENRQLSLSSQESANLDSLRISDPQSPNSVPNSVSGSMSETAANSSGSSQKVTARGGLNGKKKFSNQGTDGRVQPHSIAQGGVGSSQTSGEVSGSPPNRKANGSAGRRSQTVNANHLLNFQYNPISRSQPRAPPPRKSQKIKPYNKDLFLQANYRFVVLDSGNYTLDSLDPDKMLQWEDIICVKYSTPHPIQCPICLDSLLCPQITSCGHIFCFPCILQYLLMGEENHKAECFRKCPLCFMMISSKDLYTVYIENVKEHCVGDTIEFMLLTRKKDSFSLQEKFKGGISMKTCESFSKFILTLDVDLSVREAISDLDDWLARADSGLVDDLEKLPYVCAAMEQLKQRKKYWNAHRSSEGNKTYKFVDCKIVDTVNPNFEEYELGLGTNPPGIHDTNKAEDNVTEGMVQGGVALVQSSDTDESLEGQDGALSSSFDENKILQFSPDVSKDSKERDSYCFYQAVDGQHIILHQLNMKCLLLHFGSYDLLPSRMSGKILQLESVTQSEAIRRRYRYLSHFPLTTTFQLCEIDLRECLPPEALSPFMEEIRKREKQRKLLAKKEREDKIKADAIAAYSVPVPYNMMQDSFSPPTFSMDDFEALGSSAPVASSPPVQGGRQLFSNVARLGFAAGLDSPTLNIQETLSPTNAERRTDSSSVTGSRNQGACSFANVISREKPTESPDPRKTNESGKKGKRPSRVLLSTSGGRRY